MKSHSSHLKPWKLAMLAGIVLAAGQAAQAEDLTYRLRRDIREASESTPAEARRLPAFVRIEAGLTPYLFEARNAALHRHDEITSHVLAVHTRRIAGQLAFYPGHALAPDFARIVSR